MRVTRCPIVNSLNLFSVRKWIVSVWLVGCSLAYAATAAHVNPQRTDLKFDEPMGCKIQSYTNIEPPKRCEDQGVHANSGETKEKCLFLCAQFHMTFECKWAKYEKCERMRTSYTLRTRMEFFLVRFRLPMHEPTTMCGSHSSHTYENGIFVCQLNMRARSRPLSITTAK